MAKKYYEICPCNPANGGNGICGCIMGDQLIDDTKSYTTIATTSTNTKIEDSNLSIKQTALEWFAEMTSNLGYVSSDILKQAKEMEKKQIIDSFGVGCQVESKRLIGYQVMAEDYYNQTYKSEK